MDKPFTAPLRLVPFSQDLAKIDGTEPFLVNGDGSKLDSPRVSTGEGGRVSPLLGEYPIPRTGECRDNPRPPGSDPR